MTDDTATCMSRLLDYGERLALIDHFAGKDHGLYLGINRAWLVPLLPACFPPPTDDAQVASLVPVLGGLLTAEVYAYLLILPGHPLRLYGETRDGDSFGRDLHVHPTETGYTITRADDGVAMIESWAVNLWQHASVPAASVH